MTPNGYGRGPGEEIGSAPLAAGLGVEAEGHRHVMAATYTCTPTWRATLTTMGARSSCLRLVRNVMNARTIRVGILVVADNIDINT